MSRNTMAHEAFHATYKHPIAQSETLANFVGGYKQGKNKNALSRTFGGLKESGKYNWDLLMGKYNEDYGSFLSKKTEGFKSLFGSGSEEASLRATRSKARATRSKTKVFVPGYLNAKERIRYIKNGLIPLDLNDLRTISKADIISGKIIDPTASLKELLTGDYSSRGGLYGEEAVKAINKNAKSQGIGKKSLKNLLSANPFPDDKLLEAQKAKGFQPSEGLRDFATKGGHKARGRANVEKLIQSLESKYGSDALIKPKSGAQGKGIYRISGGQLYETGVDGTREIVKSGKLPFKLDDTFVQKAIPNPGKEYRVTVVGTKKGAKVISTFDKSKATSRGFAAYASKEGRAEGIFRSLDARRAEKAALKAVSSLPNGLRVGGVYGVDALSKGVIELNPSNFGHSGSLFNTDTHIRASKALEKSNKGPFLDRFRSVKPSDIANVKTKQEAKDLFERLQKKRGFNKAFSQNDYLKQLRAFNKAGTPQAKRMLAKSLQEYKFNTPLAKSIRAGQSQFSKLGKGIASSGAKIKSKLGRVIPKASKALNSEVNLLKASKGLGKFALKKIPALGFLGYGAYDAVSKFRSGDKVGAVDSVADGAGGALDFLSIPFIAGSLASSYINTKFNPLTGGSLDNKWDLETAQKNSLGGVSANLLKSAGYSALMGAEKSSGDGTRAGKGQKGVESLLGKKAGSVYRGGVEIAGGISTGILDYIGQGFESLGGNRSKIDQLRDNTLQTYDAPLVTPEIIAKNRKEGKERKAKEIRERQRK